MKIRMFKNLLESLGRKQLHWSTKTPLNYEVIDFGSFFASVSSGLILLPENLDNFGIAINMQDAIRKLFPSTAFSYIVREKYLSLMPVTLREKIIPLSQEEISPFGTPNRQFIKKIAARPYDLVLDLNASFDLCSTFINNRISAKLRICLSHPQRDPFYNLQVRVPAGQPLERQLNTMLKYLSQLMNSSSSPIRDLLPA